MSSFEESWVKNEPITFESTAEILEWTRFSEFYRRFYLKCSGYRFRFIKICPETIKNYNYDDYKAHPIWFEPIE